MDTIEIEDGESWRSPHTFNLKTNPLYRKEWEGMERATAEAEAAKVTEGEKEKQRQMDIWQAEKEARGLTPEQFGQVKSYIGEHVITHANKNTKMVSEDLDAIIDHCNGSREAIHKLEARIADLEKRLETKGEALDSVRGQLETLQSAHMEYRGLFNSEISYHRNSVVTDHGSAWISLIDENQSRPGDSSGRWQLMVKRGRDGRGRNDRQSISLFGV